MPPSGAMGMSGGEVGTVIGDAAERLKRPPGGPPSRGEKKPSGNGLLLEGS